MNNQNKKILIWMKSPIFIVSLWLKTLGGLYNKSPTLSLKEIRYVWATSEMSVFTYMEGTKEPPRKGTGVVATTGNQEYLMGSRLAQ